MFLHFRVTWGLWKSTSLMLTCQNWWRCIWRICRSSGCSSNIRAFSIPRKFYLSQTKSLSGNHHVFWFCFVFPSMMRQGLHRVITMFIVKVSLDLVSKKRIFLTFPKILKSCLSPIKWVSDLKEVLRLLIETFQHAKIHQLFRTNKGTTSATAGAQRKTIRRGRKTVSRLKEFLELFPLQPNVHFNIYLRTRLQISEFPKL